MIDVLLPAAVKSQAKRVLMHPAVQSAMCQVRERRQLLEYQGLLGELTDAPAYNEQGVRAQLAAKQDSRQPLWDTSGKAHIVGFGACDWEQLGFWRAFEAHSNFRFVDVTALRHRYGVATSEVMARRRTAQLFLDEIDCLRQQAPISLAFFYSDTDSFDPQLLCGGLAARGIWSVVLGLDDKHRFTPRRVGGGIVGQSTLIPHADLLWTNWPHAANLIAQRGGTAWFAPQAADGTVHAPQKRQRDIDVLFFGQRYGHRGRLIGALRRQGIAVHTAGFGWPGGYISFEESLALINRAKIVLGYGGTGAMAQVCCLKGRDFEVPMCGAVYLTSYNAELTPHYRIGEEIMCYTTPTECAEVILALLKNPDWQARLRKNARRRALRDHTWTARIGALLRLFPAST